MGPSLHDPAAWPQLTGPGVGTHSSDGPRDFFNLEPKVVDVGRGYSEPKESTVQKEEPKIYMSAVEPNTLIHEYSNRFEVYRLEAGEKELVSVEYKDAK